MIDLREALLVLVRFAHAAAAAVLVGGSTFQLLRAANGPPGDVAGLARSSHPSASVFREIVDLTLVVFLITGGLLTFERLSSGAASTLYVIVLGVKVLLSVLLYRWAFLVRRSEDWSAPPARLLVGSGFLVLLLAVLLKTLYESGLRT